MKVWNAKGHNRVAEFGIRYAYIMRGKFKSRREKENGFGEISLKWRPVGIYWRTFRKRKK